MTISTHIKRNLLGCLVGMAAMIFPNVSQAFVPTAPQLLYMMIRAMGQPAGLIVHHTRYIPAYLPSSGHASGNPEQYSLVEKLTFAYPDRLRTEIISGPNTGFTVESGQYFVKILNQVIISGAKSLEDHYTDILLFRDPERLESFLKLSGVNTDKVEYQRYQEHICYRIGGLPESLESEPSEQDENTCAVWIDHETFLPVRFCLRQPGKPKDQSIDFLYQDWQKTGKMCYPMQITMIMDNRIITTIQADHTELSEPNAHKLFDIDYIMKQYPKKIHPNSPGSPIQEIQEPGREDKIKELDNHINDFKKMYE